MIEDFVIVCGRGEVHKTFFLLFYFFFLLYLENGGGGGGRCYCYCKAGNRYWFSERGVSRERNALRDYEPFVSDANSAKSRILCLYHARRSLECTRYGVVAEDEICCS